MIKNILISIFFFISFLGVSQEADDLYFTKKDRTKDSVVHIKQRKKIYYANPIPGVNYWRPYGYNYWDRNYYHPYEYYRNRTIVIIPNTAPQTNYGKRPSRDYQPEIKSNSPRRGRDK